MTDNKVVEETLIYKLAHAKGMNWFKNICLFSCSQDSYATYDSARIQVSREAMEDQYTASLIIGVARPTLAW